MSHPMCYTIRMTIKNDMKTKDEITFVPPLKNDEHGWLNVNGEILRITNIHHFDDFGCEQETFTLEDGQEFISQDEGHTFRDLLDCE